MGKETKIAWCHHTFNPWEGCQKIAPECALCYAEDRDQRWHDGKHWGPGTPRLFHSDSYWRQPLKWDREAADSGEKRFVFCGSLCDVMEDHPVVGSQRERLYELIDRTPHLFWLLLSKRPQNFLRFLPLAWLNEPRATVGVGTSAGTQASADKFIPELLRVSAVLRFVSCEPLLEEIDIREWLSFGYCGGGHRTRSERLGWAIAGAESGHGARPMHDDWVRSLRDQCVDAGCPFFFKQRYVDGIKISLPPLDGRVWGEMPNVQ